MSQTTASSPSLVPDKLAEKIKAAFLGIIEIQKGSASQESAVQALSTLYSEVPHVLSGIDIGFKSRPIKSVIPETPALVALNALESLADGLARSHQVSQNSTTNNSKPETILSLSLHLLHEGIERVRDLSLFNIELSLTRYALLAQEWGQEARKSLAEIAPRSSIGVSEYTDLITRIDTTVSNFCNYLGVSGSTSKHEKFANSLDTDLADASFPIA